MANEASQAFEGGRVGDEALLDWALGQLPEPDRGRLERAMAENAELRARGQTVRETLNLLGRYEVEPAAGDLADRIKRAVAEEREPNLRRRRMPIFSLTEAAAIAAVLTLMAIIFIPSAFKARQMQRRNACTDHMRQVAVAMETYANQHANMLPFIRVPAGANWLERDGGRRATGTAPLFILVQQGALPTAALVCPASGDVPLAGDLGGLVDFPEAANCSYSFQNLFGASGPMLRSAGGRELPRPILADRNPLFRTGRPCCDVPVSSNSRNHGSDSGQNVLYNDGKVIWHSSPDVGLNHDNIWQAGVIREYNGAETAQGPDDTFLAP